jgi:hypothetical protein
LWHGFCCEEAFGRGQSMHPQTTKIHLITRSNVLDNPQAIW